jgi:hypothetical protein
MRIWKTYIAAALAMLALGVGVPASAQVPDPFARELAQKLARADLTLGEQGFMRAAGPFPGGVALRETRTIPLSLRAGQDYSIVAVCDDRCALDIRLTDLNGVAFARGAVEAGAWVMRIRPRFTGSHTVDVEAVRCAGQCWYAVNVYAR